MGIVCALENAGKPHKYSSLSITQVWQQSPLNCSTNVLDTFYINMSYMYGSVAVRGKHKKVFIKNLSHAFKQ